MLFGRGTFYCRSEYGVSMRCGICVLVCFGSVMAKGAYAIFMPSGIYIWLENGLFFLACFFLFSLDQLADHDQLADAA
jgi:coenzyme F420-reducing hydrogenase beta subunit